LVNAAGAYPRDAQTRKVVLLESRAIVDRSTAATDAVDAVETGWTKRHGGGLEPTCGCRKSHPTFWRGAMHMETRRFPPPYDRCSSDTTKSGIVCLRRYDVPAHRQDRVDPPHSFNPFILFTGPDEVFGTHGPERCPSVVRGPGRSALLRRQPRCQHRGLRGGYRWQGGMSSGG
jgi:hypothetical protein